MKALRVIVNWLLVFSFPLWGLFFILYTIKKEWNEYGTQRQLKSGNRWLWE